jgi:hypothetical protein
MIGIGWLKRPTYILSAIVAATAAPTLQAQQAPPAQKVAAPPAHQAIATLPNGPSSSNPAAVALDQRVIAEAQKDSQILANLTYLSDMIGPRLTGSPALKRANEWTAEVMRNYGLENVHLEPWSIPASWERGPATARIIEPNNGRTLTIAAAGWTPGTNGKIVGDVVVIDAKKKEDLQAYKGKLKGAIVLSSPPSVVRSITEVNQGTGMFGGPGGPGGGRRGMRGPGGPGGPPSGTPPGAPGGPPPANNTAGRPGQGPAAGNAGPGDRPMWADFAQRRAFMRERDEFLRSEGVAVILSDAGKPQGLLNMTGGWRDDERTPAAKPLPQAFVAHEHYALLYRLATRKPAAPTRIEIEIENKMTPGPIVVYNTVGEIRGKEKPDEVVILGAHLDSWDLGQGTTDNGTGSCVVLEAARVLSKLAKEGIQPRRTIRFILFTGEEEGLKGSQAYVKAHKDELAKISLCLVHDTGPGKVTGIMLQGREIIKPIFERELTSLRPLGVTEFNTRFMPGSDHQSFDSSRVGVPGFAVQQDMTGYALTHHSQSDTLEKVQDREKDLMQGVEVMAVTGLRVANLDTMLPRERKDSGPRFDF